MESQEGKKYEEGRWTEAEKLYYFIFLEVHRGKFVASSKRLWKIYKALSQYVGTRSPEQCRSHHRKLLLRYLTVENIIENGKRKNDT